MVQQDREKLIADLFDCVKSNQPDQAISILEANLALCDAETDEGVSILLFSLYCSQPEVTQFLLDAKTNPLDIYEASAVGDVARIRQILREEFDLNCWAPDGFTPLHLACFFDQPLAANILIAHGADVDISTNNEFNIRPIHSAAASRSARMVRILLAAGADPNPQQRGGFTALHSAANHDNLLMVNLLLANGADKSIADDEGKVAQDFAREYEFHNVVKTLDD